MKENINHEFLSASKKKKNLKCLERENESESKCARGDLFFVVAVVLIMIPVTLHCYYNALTLHVWVQFSNEENDLEKFHQDYIFFYHILVLTWVSFQTLWRTHCGGRLGNWKTGTSCSKISVILRNL